MNKHHFKIEYSYRETDVVIVEATDKEEALELWDRMDGAELSGVDQEIDRVHDLGPIPLEKDPNQIEMIENETA